MSKRINWRSLPVQLIVAFMGLVILTAAAVGLPAIFLIRNQLERQAWAQVEQGRRAAEALYAAEQSELTALATLTAQRPTLQTLLSNGDRATLTSYLGVLQAGAELDLIFVCDSEQGVLAQAGTAEMGEVCQAGLAAGYRVLSDQSGSHVWLLAVHKLEDNSDSPLLVVVGRLLDRDFARQMQTRTGLEHTLVMDGRAGATSLAGDGLSQRTIQAVEGHPERSTFLWQNRPFYATSLTLNDDRPARLTAEVALDVSSLATTQERLTTNLARSILVVAVLGSGLGVVVARWIGRPLARLGKAAANLSQGDLATPVQVQANVYEVSLVADALEAARAALQHSLAQLQTEKAWTDHLLEAIVEGIVTVDQHGAITFFSQGAERITGWRPEQVLGQLCDDVFRPLETNEPFSHLIPAPGRQQKIVVALPNGRQATLAVTGARLAPPEAGAARVALVFRDVSEEEAIHRLLGNFLANIAHEFRTPLSALAASIELLLDQLPDLSPAELQELLNSLHLGILGLQTLVDNLLEGASIETGRFRVYPRPADLGQIVGEATRLMQPLLARHRQRLTANLPAAVPPVAADPRRTQQVLVNLLSNASKYGPDGGEIIVEAMVGEQEVKVMVKDRGPGVPATQRPQLFRRFIPSSPNTDKAQYGMGLGLSVVKAIVEAQGGRVGVEDRPGGGAIFWFTLPVAGIRGLGDLAKEIS
ncbi:MAG: ATP-binding protein [Chloroflexota bacterium]